MSTLFRAAVEILRPQVEEALQVGGGFYAVEDVVAMVERGELQAWFGSRGSLTLTQVVTYPRAKVLLVFLGAGDRSDYDEIQPRLEAFAREQGCDRIRAEGRAGWARVLGSDGWERTGVVMHKVVGVAP